MSKHTPGEWRVDGPFISGCDVMAGDGSCVASDCTQADARLIAAAPDLLAAAEIAMHALDCLMGDSDLPDDDSDEMKACQALSAAIAKATGNPPSD